MSEDAVYAGIARSLREFGYSGVTSEMIRETDEARRRGEPDDKPHGIVSMFARRQLDEHLPFEASGAPRGT